MLTLINLLLGVTTVVGFALAIWQTIRAEQLNRRQRDYDWPQVLSAADHLADLARRDKYKPEILIALEDRSAIVASLIVAQLGGPRLPVVTAIHTYDQARADFDLTGYVRFN
jgi:hypothetical protein